MTTYWLSLQTEFIKGKRTFALWQSFLFPLLTILLVSLALSGTKIDDPNPWIRFVHNYGNITSFFFPFFLVIIIAYYTHLEHKSNTWKHLLTQPVPKSSIFLGKLSMILILLMLSYFFLISLGLLSSWILHLINPLKFHFNLGGINLKELSKVMLKTYLSGFLIIVLQYWFSMRFRNIIIPFIIGIGLIILPIAVLIILGMAGLLNQPKSLQHVFDYDPYAYPFSHIFNFLQGPVANLNVFPKMSIIYFCLALVVGFISYLDFRKRNF